MKYLKIVIILILLIFIYLFLFVLDTPLKLELAPKIVSIDDTTYDNKPDNFGKDYIDNGAFSYQRYQKMSINDIDILTLQKENSNVVGWLQVDSTNINYPILQTTNNSYYQNHDYYGNNSSSGWIFSDYRNDFNKLSLNTIVYGHHVKNNTMFGSIDKMFTKTWQEKSNHLIITKTTDAILVWEIFSVYEIKTETYYLQNNFQTDEDYSEFLNSLKKRSIYNFNTTLDSVTNILTLSTCNDLDDGRLVVHARLR